MFHDEAEEKICDDVVDVRGQLIDLVFGPRNGRLPMPKITRPARPLTAKTGVRVP
jgi:hypothetical protein